MDARVRKRHMSTADVRRLGRGVRMDELTCLVVRASALCECAVRARGLSMAAC